MTQEAVAMLSLVPLLDRALEARRYFRNAGNGDYVAYMTEWNQLLDAYACIVRACGKSESVAGDR